MLFNVAQIIKVYMCGTSDVYAVLLEPNITPCLVCSEMFTSSLFIESIKSYHRYHMYNVDYSINEKVKFCFRSA